MSTAPVRVRRWLILPALVVLALVTLVAIKAVSVVRGFDRVFERSVFRGKDGCGAAVLTHRGPVTWPGWTQGEFVELRFSIVSGEATVAETLPDEGKHDLETLRTSNFELLRCPLVPFERMSPVELNESLAMVPIEVRWQLEHDDPERAAVTCVEAVRFALRLSGAVGGGTGDAALLLQDLEDPCRAALERAPSHQAELDALSMPSFEVELHYAAYTELQLRIDTRRKADWRTRLDRYWSFWREETQWHALLRVIDQPGPARDEAVAALEPKVPGLGDLVDLRDGCRQSLQTLQR